MKNNYVSIYDEIKAADEKIRESRSVQKSLDEMADEAEADVCEYQDESDTMPSDMIELQQQLRAASGRGQAREKFKPGRVIGNLKLLMRMRYARFGMQDAALGVYSNGEWLCRCLGCKAPCIVAYRHFYTNTLRGRCCGKKECDPTPKAMGRPVDRSHIGEEVGRLLILDWQAGKGWICYCKVCEGEEVWRTMADIKTQGLRYCRVVPIAEQETKRS